LTGSARLAARLHCYQPEQLDETWAALRDAGARRARLIVEQTAQQAQIRDLLECVWPAALAAAPTNRFDSPTWLACLHVVTSGTDGREQRLRRGGLGAFTRAVRRSLRRFGGVNVQHKIVAAVFAALGDPTGVRARRPGALDRIGWVLDDLVDTRRRLTLVQDRMVAILDQLGLTGLVCSIPGISAVGAAAILAETGDPARFSHARALVKHAGLAPRQSASGEHVGTTRLTGRGRPRLRLAAWRAVFGALPHNRVLRERYQHLTGRTSNPLSDGQARASLAGTLLRWLHAICTHHTPFDALIATGHRHEAPLAA
jgi:transposase